MVKRNFTYIDQDNNMVYSIYRKHAPILACKSIFSKLLININDNINYKTKLIIVDIDTRKKYYYMCSAIYQPKYKFIGNNKKILQRFDVNIIKANEKVF